MDTASDATCTDTGITDTNWTLYNKIKAQQKIKNAAEKNRKMRIKEKPKKFL